MDIYCAITFLILFLSFLCIYSYCKCLKRKSTTSFLRSNTNQLMVTAVWRQLQQEEGQVLPGQRAGHRLRASMVSTVVLEAESVRSSGSNYVHNESHISRPYWLLGKCLFNALHVLEACLGSIGHWRWIWHLRGHLKSWGPNREGDS